MMQLGSVGSRVHAELNSSDASAGARLDHRQPMSLAAVTVGAAEFLAVFAAALHTAAGGDTALFFDNEGLSAARAIVAADDSGNTFTVAGEHTDEFRAGRDFEVANSSANDGSYTSTGATYDSANDQTIISVASVSDGTDDGDITSAPSITAGLTVLRGDYGADGGEAICFPFDVPRMGPVGYALYAISPSGSFDVQVEAVRRLVIERSVPVGAPGANGPTH